MSELPFYITLKGKNVISLNEINRFIDRNPELEPFIHSNKIELRLLGINTLQSLCSWIIAQQISTPVANRILHRFRRLINPLTSENILSQSLNEFRTIGLSFYKAKYIQNVAEFLQNNKELMNLDDRSSEDLRKYYMQIKGVGAWTANMHLIFVLGRKDILAPKDLVVRKGLKLLYKLTKIPLEKDVPEICKNWGDLATIGTLLAWEVAEGKFSKN